MSILDAEKQDEDGIELSTIILICILLLSGLPYRIPLVSGQGCPCNCGCGIENCISYTCPNVPCECGCGYKVMYPACPGVGQCGSSPDPGCPGYTPPTQPSCKPGTCSYIPGSVFCGDIGCRCGNGGCNGASVTLNCQCGSSNCGCRGPWSWQCDGTGACSGGCPGKGCTGLPGYCRDYDCKCGNGGCKDVYQCNCGLSNCDCYWVCDKTGQCQVVHCHCGCSKPTTGADRCGYGQCGERAQKGCANYCKCDCGNNIIECGGEQCGSPETPKPGCPSYEQDCDCPCDQSVGECGRQCGGSPIPGCKIYVEKCKCGCPDDVETCKGGQCGSAPQKGCINYVEYCSCNCKKPVQDCPEGQCDGKPKPGCPASEDICGCICKIKTNLCGGRQCGQYPSAGCPSYDVDCNCGCALDVAHCGGQQCGSTPRLGCVKKNCFCPCKSPVEACGYGQCNDEPVTGCKLKPEKGISDYFSDYGWNGWELKNPDGSTCKFCGLNPEWKLRSRAEYIDKGKGEALGFKAGVSPALVKDVPIAYGVKGTFLGGELDARLTTNEAGVKAMGYGAKFDRSLDFVPVIGKYCKVSGYVLAAGGKAVVDWEKGKGTFGAAALFGASIEINYKDMAVDAYRAVSGWFKGSSSIREHVMHATVLVWTVGTDILQDHNAIQLVSKCHTSADVVVSDSEDCSDQIWMMLSVAPRSIRIDLGTDLVEHYVEV